MIYTEKHDELEESGEILSEAQNLAKSGIPVFPCNKNKAPMLKDGFKAASTEEAFILDNFDQANVKIGVPMGEITCIDIDAKHQPGLIEAFEKAIKEAGLEITLDQLPKQTTINQGCHYFAKVVGLSDQIRNLKLAKKANKETIIETRGKGGYVCVAPSDGYKWQRGNLRTTPEIKAEIWKNIVEVAKGFDQAPQTKPKEQASRQLIGDGTTPGDDFNRRGDCLAILQAHGWRPAGGRYWTRPGKNGGVSATWDSPETPGKFYVFSSSAHPFEPESSYSPFAVYAMLEHQGDFSAAARTLGGQGYGEKTKRQNPPIGNDWDALEREINQAGNLAEDQKKLADEWGIGTTDQKPKPKTIWDSIADFTGDLPYINGNEEPEEMAARVMLKEVPIAEDGDLIAVTARLKSFKTSIMNALLGASFAENADTLGLTVAAEGVRILFDTEQSEREIKVQTKAIRKRLGAKTLPNQILIIGLREYQPSERWAIIKKVVEDNREAGIALIALDGVTDLDPQINDPERGAVAINFLQVAASRANCPLFAAIHLNHSDKDSEGGGRGHIGKELERKAKTVLVIEKDKEGVGNIFAEVTRFAPIYRKDGQRIAWSDEAGMVVSLNQTAEEAKEETEKQYLEQLLRAIIERTNMRAWSRKDLIEELLEAEMELLGKTKKATTRTGQNRVNSMQKHFFLKVSQENGNLIANLD